MRRLKWLLTIIFAVSLGVIFSQVFLKRDTAHEEKEETITEKTNEVELTKESQGIIDIKTVEVKLSTFMDKISVIGQIAQDVEQTTHVVSPETGILREKMLEIGSIVKKDDVLCVIKTNGINSFLEIKAPISGIIIGDFSKVGDKVDSVSSIYTIADLSKLWATFDVHEKDIAKVRLGREVLVYSIAYPEKTFFGKITFISTRVDETTRTIKIRTAVKNPDFSLMLGMFVTGEIIVENEEKNFILPASAVQIMGDKRVVFAKIDDELFQMKEVKIKSETKDEVGIIEGLKEGDSVVTEGAFFLKSDLLKSELEGE